MSLRERIGAQRGSKVVTGTIPLETTELPRLSVQPGVQLCLTQGPPPWGPRGAEEGGKEDSSLFRETAHVRRKDLLRGTHRAQGPASSH